ncbi:NDP-sugar epimerase, includes UDP-GlcNAc-inverting 4,6-dehydratase FlaA1 and capsular polysaccharide biosynthesis protein EpsC [Cohaesibacter sp. ES.047]|nr:NDP-sugar epimerase, includes UDP-GlcNAc-inverting 4,6-dehydratase FlaA1 and capsular polysaccharide biosynthesis protein EpsC [Cohaesibacter sp. ES.047]
MMMVDAILIPICLWCAYVLRLAEWWPWERMIVHWWVFPFASIAGVAIFTHFRIYRSVLRYIGSHTLVLILKSIVLLSVCIMILGFFVVDPIMPRSVPILFAFVCTAYVASTRYLYRYYYRWVLTHLLNKESVAIYGAGGAGVQLATALADSAEFKAVAYIDDSENLQGAIVHGLRVYSGEDLIKLVESLDIKHVLLALPSASPDDRSRIVEKLARANINALTVPAMSEIVTGRAQIDTLRKLEIKDLLGRKAVVPDQALITASLLGKSVMVTGAGGSIGSEICRQVIRNNPKKLVLFEACEYNLYSIERELNDHFKSENLECEILPILGNVCDENHIHKVISTFGIQTIYHAAAYKHVPLVEQNVLVGIRNNIFGTKTVCESAIKLGVERFILISTDKAVRTTNIMGATKRFAELIVQDIAKRSDKTIFTMVRFGNVLGSSGSVVPLFLEQIDNGGPVTITHPDITRYFMTIPEAALLVIQAGSLAVGGDVFVLEMGKKVKIVDLACRMIELSGRTVKNADNPHGEIEIAFTGLRPGEKMTEELVIGCNISNTVHPYILTAQEDVPSSEKLQSLLEALDQALTSFNIEHAIEFLSDPMIGFTPKSGIVDCIDTQQRMELGTE